MAYIPNGSCLAAERFAEDCARCKYGEKFCPIQHAQTMYNYLIWNDKLAKAILDRFVDDDGNCKVLECFKDDLLEEEK